MSNVCKFEKRMLPLRPILKPKKNTMKKLFSIIAVAAVMASCTGGDSDKSANTDSTKNADSIVNDATKTLDAAKDSMNKMVDATKDSMNKAVEAVKDSVVKH